MCTECVSHFTCILPVSNVSIFKHKPSVLALCDDRCACVYHSTITAFNIIAGEIDGGMCSVSRGISNRKLVSINQFERISRHISSERTRKKTHTQLSEFLFEKFIISGIH